MQHKDKFINKKNRKVLYTFQQLIYFSDEASESLNQKKVSKRIKLVIT